MIPSSGFTASAGALLRAGGRAGGRSKVILAIASLPIGPGAVQTSLRANTVRILGDDAPVMRGVGGDDAAVKAITPAERRGTIEEIAACAVFLCGEAASYVTGHTLVVDGGWTAR